MTVSKGNLDGSCPRAGEMSLADRHALTVQVKTLARELGFDPVGVTSAEPFRDTERVILDRLRRGLMDGLPWFFEDRVRRGCNPEAILTGARSIIALALTYHGPEPPEPRDGQPRGRVSRYAWGRDYHRVFEQRTKRLLSQLKALGLGRARFYVDYGPMPDRAVAVRAGIGWHGKNTNVLSPGKGSWLFLAEILTDLDLESDAPLSKSCGACAACIPACPTSAIVSPYVIDNTRCISFHTIESRGPIPRELRPLFGDWVFGCDVCQDVCTVNHRAKTDGDPEFAAGSLEDARPDLLAILDMSEVDFQSRYRGSPLKRATRAGLRRNACVTLGNLGTADAVPALSRTLREGEPLVRGHAAWALGRIGGSEAAQALDSAFNLENDAAVLSEIRLALDDLKEKATRNR